MDRLREAVMMADIMMGVMVVEEGTVDVAEGGVVDLEAEEGVSEGHGNFKSTAFRCILSSAFYGGLHGKLVLCLCVNHINSMTSSLCDYYSNRISYSKSLLSSTYLSIVAGPQLPVPNP
jgi:hypothetical protein